MDTGAVPDIAAEDAVYDVVSKYRVCGHRQHCRFGGARRAGRLRLGAAQVRGRSDAHHSAIDHLSAAWFAAVHSTVSHFDESRYYQHPCGADRYLSDVLDAVRDMGDARLLPLDPRGSGRCGDDRRRDAAWSVFTNHTAAGRASTAFGHAVRLHQRLERVSVRFCVYY